MTPVFIGGTGRCGSTLLRNVLGKHPSVYMIPGESNPHPYRHKEWMNLRWTPAIDELQPHHTHLVEKSPQNAVFGLYLLERFKKIGARYVHIARDTERTVDSIMKFGRLPHEHLGHNPTRTEAIKWVEWINQRGADWASLREDCLWVSFDWLVREPRETLENLLNWLDLPWDQPWFDELAFDRSKAA